MNKGAHISLAFFLMRHFEKLGMHKRAFLIGSILPDCRPSFLTTRHTITETYDLLLSELRTVTEENNKELSANVCIHLGIIMHYLADYYTHPHNNGYQGGVKEHIEYERGQSVALKKQLEEINMDKNECKRLLTLDEISDFIIELHANYMTEVPDMITDCKYIIRSCYSVTAVLLQQITAIQTIEMAGTQAA